MKVIIDPDYNSVRTALLSCYGTSGTGLKVMLNTGAVDLQISGCSLMADETLYVKILTTKQDELMLSSYEIFVTTVD